MRLRHHLIIISLCTLIFPILGIQIIQEMENTLRQVQTQHMTETGQMITRLLQAEPKNLSLFERNNNSSLYAHPLNSAMQLDGYGDDWRALSVEPINLSDLGTTQTSTTLSGSLLLGEGKHHYWLYLTVKDDDITYQPATPYSAKPEPPQGDYLALFLSRDNEKIQRFVLYTARPGEISGIYRQDGERLIPARQIRGFWQENNDGYQLELSIEKTAGNQLNLVVHSRNHTVVLDDPRNTSTRNIISRSPALSQSLAPLVGEGKRLHLIDSQGWLIATAGDFDDDGYSAPSITLASLIYPLILGSNALPPYDSPLKLGRFKNPSLQQPLQDEITQSHFQQERYRIDRVALPLTNHRGALILEEKSDPILSSTRSAFSRLLLYSIFASISLGLGLLLYASWLSWRIRKLSHNASSALDNQGRLRGNFIRSKSKDEIGDLSRNFSELLSRLHEYSEYQRTLGNKLSHELRTPLAVTRSSLDNLALENDDAQRSVYQQRAESGLNRLSEILNAISGANRVEESIQHADVELTDVKALLEQLIPAYQSTFSQTRFNLEIKTERAQLTLSPELLVQQLDKLIENAIDFVSEDGGITICLEHINEHWQLSVSNDGPVLPEAMQSQLFDSMVSMRSSDHDDNVHLGLGLHIVRLIAHFHGGDVTAKNRDDNGGVIFAIRLPKNSPL